ncbi:uncharacterized protein LOC132644021 [Lycium barbarum]|uniref:uncharacterized protein LOC132644021 n=1 Tax=Lycium barbarum TaxID=112863 RepID=UPI00293ECB69|nr:uncharacterized protein LOC132644021 [Lycium barbarum]
MAPFEALYFRRCCSSIGWCDAFEVQPWGTILLKESLDKVKLIQEKLLAAQNWQTVFLRVSPMKGFMRFGKSGKLSSRYIGPFEILRRICDVAYELALPQGLSGVHAVFHVCMMKRYHSDGSYIIRRDSVLLDKNLSYEEEPIAILDRHVGKLRSKEIAFVKVQYKNCPIEEATWETTSDMRTRYPQLFADSDFEYLEALWKVKVKV